MSKGIESTLAGCSILNCVHLYEWELFILFTHNGNYCLNINICSNLGDIYGPMLDRFGDCFIPRTGQLTEKWNYAIQNRANEFLFNEGSSQG